MTPERIIQDLQTVNDAYLLEAKSPVPTKKRTLRPGRIALIAACLCALLAVGAVAADTVRRHVSTGEIVSATRSDGNVISYFEATIPITKLPLDALSKEARDFAAGHMSLPAEKEFPDWNAAERFLGLELADSPMLEGAWKMSVRFDGRTDSPSSVMLFFSSVWSEGAPLDPGPHGVVREESYTTITVHATVFTEAMLATATETRWTYNYQGSEPVTTHTWVTSSGVEVLLADVPDSNQHSATFVWNGTAFHISVDGTDGADANLSFLKQLIESFR